MLDKDTEIEVFIRWATKQREDQDMAEEVEEKNCFIGYKTGSYVQYCPYSTYYKFDIAVGMILIF